MDTHTALAYGYSFIAGLCISFALYSAFAMLFTWWVALLCATLVQPALVFAYEALRPGDIERGCTAAASYTLKGVARMRSLFATKAA